MPSEKENSNSNRIHNKVLFKKMEEQNKLNKIISRGEVDQKNRIILATELKQYGGYYRYAVLFANQSSVPITHIKIKIGFPKFLKLFRSSPHAVMSTKVEYKYTNFFELVLDQLPDNTSKQFNTYIYPDGLNIKGIISTHASYVNNKDIARILTSLPKEIKIKSVSFEEKTISNSDIKEFTESDGIKKAIRSYGIGTESKKDINSFFDHLMRIIKYSGFTLIAKDDSKRIGWFFGTESETKSDVLLIGEIMSNKIEFLVFSQDQGILIPILTYFFVKLKESALDLGLVENVNQILNLECRSCGTTLPHFPEKGVSIECKNCGYQQILW